MLFSWICKISMVFVSFKKKVDNMLLFFLLVM